ncbi:MAG TPA: hypothetical protein VFU02_11795, partial [Polyangiaceae bacterium]|nr:hypothetical protein [Polyangiaceae bacterium]
EATSLCRDCMTGMDFVTGGLNTLGALVSASHLGDGWSVGAGLLNPLFEKWDAEVFEKERWRQTMVFVRITLSVLGAIFLMYELRARKMHVRIPLRVRKRLAIAMTAIAFFTYYDFFNPNVRYVQYYHRHEFYHYYLGSKYFKEVGYKRLYECTAVAEIDNGRRSSIERRQIRDLSVNLIKKTQDTYVLDKPEQCKKHFTPARWEAFRKDIDWFQKNAPGTYWENMQKDHGYNPPPVWTMTGKLFGSFGPASDGYFKVLASLDILLQLGAVLLINWAFGWRTMMVATIFWGTNRAADFYWTGGAFLRMDWIFFLVASVCCARKRKFALAGGALMWSSLLRVFPLVLFFGYGVIVLFHSIRRLRERREAARTGAKPKRRGKEQPNKGLLGLIHPDHQRLIAGAAIALGVLVPASMVVAGPDSYKAFVQHTIAVHSNTPLTNHMGIDTILTHTWDGRMRFTRNENLDDPFQVWKAGRLERKEDLSLVRRGITLALMLWIAWALRRTKLLWVGPALSVVLVMSLVDLTCYYYSLFMIVAVLIRARPPLGPTLLAGSGASALLLWDSTGFYYVDDRFTVQAYLFLILALLSLYTYSRPFSMERLRAWWRGMPEPKPDDRHQDTKPVVASSA